MSLIAQSFENFEALIKDIYREHLKLSIKDETVMKLVLQQTPRKNNEVIKALKAFFPSLENYLSTELISWIRAIEHIRHAVVHNDQLLDWMILFLKKAMISTANIFLASRK